jgi:hypothetical protein
MMKKTNPGGVPPEIRVLKLLELVRIGEPDLFRELTGGVK